MTQRILKVFFFLFVVPGVLYSLREWGVEGGDSKEIALLATRPWYFFMRAPLVFTLHHWTWLLLKDFGLSPGDCIALSSSLAGGVFLWGLLRFSRDPRVVGIVLLSKFSLVFVGHIENYAWPYALAMWAIALLRDFDEEGAPPSWAICAVMALAAYCHPMTLMIWPGVVWGLRPIDRKKLTEIVTTVLLIAGLLIPLLLFGKTGGFVQKAWILPLFDTEGTPSRYALFSASHWTELLGFYLWTMPLGVALLIRYGWRQWRGWRGGLALTALIALVWSVVWRPGMGAADWDLFAWPALFVNLAGGYAWCEAARGKRDSDIPETKPQTNPDPSADASD